MTAAKKTHCRVSIIIGHLQRENMGRTLLLAIFSVYILADLFFDWPLSRNLPALSRALIAMWAMVSFVYFPVKLFSPALQDKERIALSRWIALALVSIYILVDLARTGILARQLFLASQSLAGVCASLVLVLCAIKSLFVLTRMKNPSFE